MECFKKDCGLPAVKEGLCRLHLRKQEESDEAAQPLRSHEITNKVDFQARPAEADDRPIDSEFAEEPEPVDKLCACGKPDHHRGRCLGVPPPPRPAQQSKTPLQKSNGSNGNGSRGQHVRDAAGKMLEALLAQRSEIDGKIEACEKVIELSKELWG